MRALGLDLSLAATGVAVFDTDKPEPIEVTTVSSKSTGDSVAERLIRFDTIKSGILAAAGWGDEGVDLVVIEAPSFGSKYGSQHERAGLWWLAVEFLRDRINPEFVAVPPTTLKKFVTGKGTADKDAVLLAVARQWPNAPISNNNEADAFALAAMGIAHFGGDVGVDLTKPQREALDKVDWP